MKIISCDFFCNNLQEIETLNDTKVPRRSHYDENNPGYNKKYWLNEAFVVLINIPMKEKKARPAE
jgi:hypothetical protein